MLAGIAVGLLLLVGGLAAASPGAGWLKPRIEAAVQRATGRALGIGGPLRVGWNLTLDASDVTLANMAGGSRPVMAQVGRIHASLALLPLLHREIRVTDLELVDPRVLIERNAAGVVNWQLSKAKVAPTASSEPASASGSIPWSFALDRLSTIGGSLAWHDARGALADGQRPLPAIRAAFDDASPVPQPMANDVLTWRSGPLPKLSNDATPVPLHMAWHAADFALALDGSITPQWPPPQYDLTAKLSAPAAGSLRDALLRLRVLQGQPARAELAATLGREALHGTASVGIEALGGAAAPVQAAVSLAGATANASGTLAPGAAGLDATVSSDVPDSARLAALAGTSLSGSGRYGITGHLLATRQRIALDAMRLAMPPGDLAGDMAWTIGERPSLVADLASQRLDLAALRAMAASLRPTAAAPPAGAAAPAPPAAHVISDRPLPLGGLDRFDADVRLRVATLANPDLRDAAVRLLLRDGRLAIEPFTANAGGPVEGSLRVDMRQPAPAASMTLHAPSLAIGWLLRAARLPMVADGTVALDADLRAAGRTPHELAATLSGTAHASSAGATLDAAAFAGLLHAAHLPPLGDGRVVALRCLVVGVNAAGGKANVAPLLLDSGRLALQGEGQVDLGAETLALQLRPMLRTGPGIVLPLRVSGGWRAPKLSSDLGAALGTGNVDPCAASPAPAAAPPGPSPVPPLPGAPAKRKLPKPIDILRGLLR